MTNVMHEARVLPFHRPAKATVRELTVDSLFTDASSEAERLYRDFVRAGFSSEEALRHVERRLSGIER